MPDGAHCLDRVQRGQRGDRAARSGPRRRRRTASPSSSARSATAARRSTRSRPSTASAAGSLDFVFLDHDKDAYLPDLEAASLDRGWLHPGSVVVADNVKFPGAPDYREYMRAQEGRTWRTIEHETHVEYQTLIKDLVLESEYLGGAG